MTNAADNDLRPTLEGTLADFPIAELLGLLASTRQTGTLQVAVRPAALLTIVDGRVAFASTDPAFTVRDLLLEAGAVTADLWQRTVSTGVDVATLGEALVDAGADPDALQRALRDQIVRVCESLLDQPGERFRFVRQARSSMGEAFTCTAAVLRETLLTRSAEWERLRSVVPSNSAEVVVRPALAADCEHVEIARGDWPVLLAVASPATPAELESELGLGIFEMTQSLVRLWESGTILVDGRSIRTGAEETGSVAHAPTVDGSPLPPVDRDDPFAASTVPPGDEPELETDGVAGDQPNDGFEELRAAFSSF